VIDFSIQDRVEDASEQWVEKQSFYPFNLEERLFDFALLKLSEEEWVWYFSIHHIIGDNWSVQLIFRRLQEFYRASLSNTLEMVQPFPQYESYVAYEREHQKSQTFRNTERYWNEKFSDPIEPLSFYGNRLTRTGSRSRRISIDLGYDRTKRLIQLANKQEFFVKSQDASMLNVFATLIFTCLYRASGNHDLVIASTFHNRRTPEFKDTIGLFMEALALRVTIEEDETFISLNQKVTKETIEILQHRQYPLRNPIFSPIYEIVLNYHKLSFPTFLDKPVDFLAIDRPYDEDLLEVHIRDYADSGSLKIAFDFNRSVFPIELSERILSDFEKILEAFLSDPGSRIDQVNLLSQEEQNKVLYEFNQTEKPFPERGTISRWFEEQVTKTPDHIAVVMEDHQLTYSQLNFKSNQIAHHLRSLGVQPDDIVGLHAERSLDMIVGILAILKAGGAYLPLDPKLPDERLKFMLEDSNTKIVLTQKSLCDQLPNIPEHVLILDEVDQFGGESREYLTTTANSHHLAYVIYTSGTTGEPKGVMVEHSSLMNFVQWAREDWSLDVNDRVLQFTALSWDAHIEEIFPALSSGVTIILRTENMIDTFQGFLDHCKRLEITVLDLPTAYWQELTDAILRDDLEFPPTVRLVLIGGERTTKKHVEAWLDTVGTEVRLLNDYGLTECTSISIQYDLREGIPPDATGVPIGLPISNVQAYVLDPHMNPVAIGIPGELWIGGSSLARGYLNDPGLTKEQFQSNFIDGTPGDRFFRTGDLARRLPDGNLEILGRLDLQVKIRGYRVELGEIEAALNEHPRVKEAITIGIENLGESTSPESGKTQLVAYYTALPSQDDPLESTSLRDFLKRKLPDYMVPSHFVELKSFPLNPNGKVDRDALPHPDFPTLTSEKTFQRPQTELEKRLQAIWEKTLDIRPIGLQDNFFELGGHSLLAVRLFSMIEKELNTKLPLADFFESPTIASQAQSIQSQRVDDGPTIVAVESGGEKPPFFCVSPTIIDVMTYIELSKNMGADQPFYALYSRKLGQWRTGVEKRKSIAIQFIEKIREVDPQGPYLIGGYSAGGVIALEIAQQMKKLGLEVNLLVLFDTFGPIPPQRLPWVTPWMFNAFRVLRRVEGYFWKFWLLDWKAKLEYLQISKIQSWAQDRYREVIPPPIPEEDKDEDPLSLKRGEYTPDNYGGDVLLIRAEKGLLGVEYDPSMGWGQTFTGNFETCFVPGDHEAILFGPRSKYVAERLNSFLSAANKKINK
jgi:amino acid adenylation domain-containing protein